MSDWNGYARRPGRPRKVDTASNADLPNDGPRTVIGDEMLREAPMPEWFNDPSKLPKSPPGRKKVTA